LESETIVNPARSPSIDGDEFDVVGRARRPGEPRRSVVGRHRVPEIVLPSVADLVGETGEHLEAHPDRLGGACA
jgi:hypothetical protein